ncbi:putative PAS/PAC sensor protein [Marinobacter lipolyticus SM19]|uniref:Putative PAS/PAC sensor protein n=1 Tax=Marinobacter lipolyticus SM19 TaxID=1318628 RepID=R8B0F6_9GAMM|nr:PAS domain-containing protein [Marinobacter lipolyticus]EON92054.1 putative PAS/PAC sensor protein [Marinobacter lipolyticus SM19]
MDNTHGKPNSESHDRLRRSARDLIDHGVPPSNRGGSLSVDALQLLYQRASNPESAADALKLLHEMQTYQVELDLLYEQLQANEQEITEELAHYKSLYAQAPAAYLVVANDGEIIEGNQAADLLFGDSAQPLTGKPLSALLAPDQKGSVDALFRNTEEQGSGRQPTKSVVVELPDRRRLIINSRSAVSEDSILMILTEAMTPSASS